MKFSPRLLVLGAVLAVFTFAMAQDVSGAWKGKISMDTSKIPAPKDEQGKKMLEQVKTMLGKMKITLNLNSNKTYAMKATGLPNSMKDQVSEGTWKQSGKSITLTPTKENGKKPTGESAKPVTLTLSADGKKMSMAVPGAAGMGGSLVFTR
ncbi:MAG TPA: lipocalin family protein [Fimbriimonadaceae bacterium]|mgnify:CR=1 FL=1|nr:lipocalin family protein [Fimbriimonadaceae bacterium]HRJ96340.1 lipocalin family protein [Fimbriimonadaceae bacterium]